MVRSRPFVLATLVLLGSASAARAEGFVSPGVGVAFDNSATRGRANFVLDVGWLSPQPVGVEVDATFAPSFFDNQASSGPNDVSTVMANVILTSSERRHFGRFRGGRTRPYISGGVGIMHEAANTPAFSRDDLGANIGLGFIMVSRRALGFRGDVRYFRDFVSSGNGDVGFGALHFWRASIGAALGF